MNHCPSHEQLRASLTGELAEAATDEILSHAESCSSCESAIEELESEVTDPIEQVVRNAKLTHAKELNCERMIQDSSLFMGRKIASSSSASNETFSWDDTVRLIELVPGVDSIRDYLVRERLGQGGMGTVYLATHRHLKRDVAIKVLKPRRSRDEDAVGRFRKEMEAVGRLDHKNIIRAMDAGETDGTLYLVMERIVGIDAGQLVTDGPIPVEAACDVVQQTALGLEYAHRQRMVHRDIKPTNLMITPDGTVKILDFGIATFDTLTINRWDDDGRLVSPGSDELDETDDSLAGSLAYMAPEQCRNSQNVHAAADIFALGCTFYQFLAGSGPFALSGDILSQLQQRRDTDLDKVSLEQLDADGLPGNVLSLLERMLAVDSDMRPTAAEIARELSPFCASSQLTALVRLKTGPNQTDEIDQSIGSFPLHPDVGTSRGRVLAANSFGGRRAGLFCIGACVLVCAGWFVFGRQQHDPLPATSDSVQAQFLEQVSQLDLMPSSIELATSTCRIVVRHGYDIAVISDDGTVNANSWNALSLKFKHRDAYELYAKHSDLMTQIDNGATPLFPHRGDAFPDVNHVMRVLQEDQKDWRCFEVWTPEESIRLIIGPGKLARASISREGTDETSGVLPIQSLRESEHYAPWISRFEESGAE